MLSANKILPDLNIPESYGKIASSFSGTTGKTIFYIQDCHSDSTAQLNISNIIKKLAEEYKVNLIFAEGTAGKINTTFYDSFPDDLTKDKTCRLFLKKGLFTGSEFSKITNRNLILNVYGIEDRKTYLNNLLLFRLCNTNKNTILKFIDVITPYDTKLKQVLYSSQLKKFERFCKSFHSSEIEFDNYINNLATYCSKTGVDIFSFKEFSKILSACVKNKAIESFALEVERKKIIDVLCAKINDTDKKILASYNLRLKNNLISEHEYYGLILGLAQKTPTIDLSFYPLISFKMHYSNLMKNLNYSLIRTEIDTIEDKVKLFLCDNSSVSRLVLYSKALSILKDFAELTLTPNQSEFIKNNKEFFDVNNIKDFYSDMSFDIGIETPEIENFKIDQDLIVLFNSFYQIVGKRDTLMVENTLKTFKKSKSDACILIAGGFHSNGITENLKSEGISYFVIQPQFSGQDLYKLYEDKLMGIFPDFSSINNLLSQKINAPLITGNTSPEYISLYAKIIFYMYYQSDYMDKTYPSLQHLEIEDMYIILKYVKEEVDKNGFIDFETLKNIVEVISYNKSLRESAKNLVSILDERDPYTAEHSRKVSSLAELIAFDMGLTVKQRELICYSGLLHDIGKIMIPDRILFSPSRLSGEDFEFMKKHVTIGTQILEQYGTFDQIIPGVKHHHERYDGTGYFDNLQGLNIPLMARIICVADSFDAIVTQRSYKPKQLISFAVEQIEAKAGAQFDPEIVAVFMRCYTKYKDIPGSPFFEEEQIDSPLPSVFEEDEILQELIEMNLFNTTMRPKIATSYHTRRAYNVSPSQYDTKFNSPQQFDPKNSTNPLQQRATAVLDEETNSAYNRNAFSNRIKSRYLIDSSL